MSLSRPLYHPGEKDEVSKTSRMTVIRQSDNPFVGLDDGESRAMAAIIQEAYGSSSSSSSSSSSLNANKYWGCDGDEETLDMDAFVGSRLDDSDSEGNKMYANILRSYIEFPCALLTSIDYKDGDVDKDYVELQDADGTWMKYFCGNEIGCLLDHWLISPFVPNNQIINRRRRIH